MALQNRSIGVQIIYLLLIMAALLALIGALAERGF
jgi:hypothetical protein